MIAVIGIQKNHGGGRRFAVLKTCGDGRQAAEESAPDKVPEKEIRPTGFTEELSAPQQRDLARFFNAGDYSRRDVHETLSPSMDIQVASNFERYLYYRAGEDPAALLEK